MSEKPVAAGDRYRWIDDGSYLAGCTVVVVDVARSGDSETRIAVQREHGVFVFWFTESEFQASTRHSLTHGSGTECVR